MTKTQQPITDAEPVAPPSVPPLPADLDAGLRRLKLAAVRRTASEVLITAKTQRWTPEEVLRTLAETELAARDASNVVNRHKAAAFPVPKTLDSFDVIRPGMSGRITGHTGADQQAFVNQVSQGLATGGQQAAQHLPQTIANAAATGQAPVTLTPNTPTTTAPARPPHPRPPHRSPAGDSVATPRA